MRKRSTALYNNQPSGWKEWFTRLSLPLLVIAWLSFLFIQEQGLTWPPSLDFSGGTRLTYEIDERDAIEQGLETPQQRRQAVENGQEVFLFRLRNFDLNEIVVKTVGDEQIVVEVSGTEELNRVKEEIGAAGYLTFRIITQDAPISLEEFNALPSAEQRYFYQFEETSFYFKVSEPVFDPAGLDYGGIGTNITDGDPSVVLAINTDAQDEFAELTDIYFGRRLAIALDNVVISAPEIADRGIREPIITGEFTFEEVNDLVNILSTGPLPVSLNLISETLVSPRLGQENLQRGLIALLVGVGLIILLLVLVYSDHYALLAVLGITITLEGILLYLLGVVGLLTLNIVSLGGLVVLLGISVDNLILVFEEFRQQQVGRPIPQIKLLEDLYNAYQNERGIILLANITTILVLLPLYLLEGSIRDLVTVMGLGIIVTLLVTVWYASKLLRTEELVLPLEKISPLRPLISTRLNLDSISRLLQIVYFSATAIALGSILFIRLNLGLDFTGGSQIQISSEKGIGTDSLQDDASTFFGDRVEVKRIRDSDTLGDADFNYAIWIPHTNTMRVNSESPEREDGGQVLTELNITAGNFVSTLNEQYAFSILLDSVDSLGPTVIGLRTQTVNIAIVLSTLPLMILVALAYGGGYAFPVLAALLLDGLIVIGSISLTSIPLSMPVIAALLIVIGYSINDSIVLCGHVSRESKEIKKYLDDLSTNQLNEILDNPKQGASKFFNQIFANLSPRIIVTSLTTIIVSTVLAIVGQGILRDFGLIITIGVTFGTISSITVVTGMLKSNRSHLAEIKEQASNILKTRVPQRGPIGSIDI